MRKYKKESGERLHKILASLGQGSRRELETMIVAGQVTVNGKVAKLGDRINMAIEPDIRINGQLLSLKTMAKPSCRVLIYYKVDGEICTRHDPEGRAIVFARLPKIKNARWISIGRLDINTSGLLLFTTDGELANRLMHPRYQIEREYSVRIFGDVSDSELNKLKAGVILEDGILHKFKSVKKQGGEGINQWFNVIITEGHNREVRKIWGAIGKQVSRLIRIRYGNIQLPRHLSRGGWQELEDKTVIRLCNLVGLYPESDEKRKQIKHSQTSMRNTKIKSRKTDQVKRA